MKALLKNKLVWLGAGLVLLLLIIAVVVVLATGILTKNSTGELIVDTSNPQGAADLINKYALTTAQNIPVGKVNQTNFASDFIKLGLPAIQGTVTSVEFSLNLDLDNGTNKLTAAFNGFVKSTGENKYDMSLDGTLSDANGASMPITLIDVDNALYLKVGTIPQSFLTDLASATGTADPTVANQLSAYFTALENKWIKTDAASEQLVGSSIPATTTDITDSDKQKLIDMLTANALFINPKAANSRTVGSDNLGCMTMEVNPALDENQNIVKYWDPLELCTKGENQLPVLVGLSFKDTNGNPQGKVEVEIVSYNKNLPLSAPTDAKTIQELMLGM